MSRWLAFLAGALIAAPGADPAAAVGQETTPSTSWRVVFLPQVDLWYHGLATAGFEGLGPDALYDPGYAQRTAAARRAEGADSTPLDGQASRLGSALRSDPTFEVFHFIPLYFASTTVVPMLDALSLVASSEGTPAVQDMLAQFGASAVALTIPEPGQRVVLGEWTDALRAEWDVFFADYWRKRAIENGPFIQSVQAEWDEHFAPRLASYLRGYALSDGVLVLSDPVGPEGRIFEGDPANPADNIVVVGFDAGTGVRAPLYAAVREMCFPVAREVLAAQPSAPSRTAAATVSSNAAVRCGAYLLDRFAPELAPGYRSAFASQASGSSTDAAEAFERKYPIAGAVSTAIQERLGAIPVS